MSLEEEEAEHKAALEAACSQVDVEKLPPRQVDVDERRSRYLAKNSYIPISPHQLIDGKLIRSALLINRKRKKDKKIVFPDNAVSGCLEPANPWKDREYEGNTL